MRDRTSHTGVPNVTGKWNQFFDRLGRRGRQLLVLEYLLLLQLREGACH
jgi:hypothetical protein